MEKPRSRILTRGPEYEEAAASFARAEAERAIWTEMWPELRAKYPRQFVARVGRDIVAVQDDLLELAAHLETMGLQPPDDVAVEYIYDGTESLIL